LQIVSKTLFVGSPVVVAYSLSLLKEMTSVFEYTDFFGCLFDNELFHSDFVPHCLNSFSAHVFLSHCSLSGASINGLQTQGIANIFSLISENKTKEKSYQESMLKFLTQLIEDLASVNPRQTEHLVSLIYRLSLYLHTTNDPGRRRQRKQFYTRLLTVLSTNVEDSAPTSLVYVNELTMILRQSSKFGIDPQETMRILKALLFIRPELQSAVQKQFECLLIGDSTSSFQPVLPKNLYQLFEPIVQHLKRNPTVVNESGKLLTSTLQTIYQQTSDFRFDISCSTFTFLISFFRDNLSIVAQSSLVQNLLQITEQRINYPGNLVIDDEVRLALMQLLQRAIHSPPSCNHSKTVFAIIRRIGLISNVLMEQLLHICFDLSKNHSNAGLIYLMQCLIRSPQVFLSTTNKLDKGITQPSTTQVTISFIEKSKLAEEVLSHSKSYSEVMDRSPKQMYSISGAPMGVDGNVSWTKKSFTVEFYLPRAISEIYICFKEVCFHSNRFD